MIYIVMLYIHVCHKAITKYKKRVRQVLWSQLNARNQVIAINIYTLSVIRYPADIIKWNEEAIKETEQHCSNSQTDDGAWSNLPKI